LAQLHDGKGEPDSRRDREQRNERDDGGDTLEQAVVLLRADELADGVGDFVQVELRAAARGGGR
jgi:hypothetical protein